MAQGLRVLAALAEDHGLVPSTHVTMYKPSVNSVLREPVTSVPTGTRQA